MKENVESNFFILFRAAERGKMGEEDYDVTDILAKIRDPEESVEEEEESEQFDLEGDDSFFEYVKSTKEI